MSDWRNLPNDENGMTFRKIRLDAIPARLDGKTVLDLGGYDGIFAKLCLGRGARQATVVDNKQWEKYGWGGPAHYTEVTYIDESIEDWQTPGDFVICYNVLYHVKDPWGFCDHLRKLTNGQLVLCTSFVPGNEPSWRVWGPGDPNWKDDVYWKPTLAGLWKLLENTGWEVEGVGRAGDHVVVRCH